MHPKVALGGGLFPAEVSTAMLLTTHAEAEQVHITVHLHENVARDQKLEVEAICRPEGLGSRG